ncbi:MAG: hypothetical protein FJ086_19725 [Deltaproteobacteria bacterium]|nr:hypothetical protein [Deltaproteobacteria bacterium]
MRETPNTNVAVVQLFFTVKHPSRLDARGPRVGEGRPGAPPPPPDR